MRSDLTGLTITSADGYVATVNGTPEESAAGLGLQWCYRGSMMLTHLSAGLTVAQVTAELAARMETIDADADLAALVGEVV